MAFGLVAAGQMASTLFPSTSILTTWLSLLDVGVEFGCADDPMFGTPFPRHRVQSPAIGRAIESREKGGEKHIQFKPSRIGSIGNTW
jgi:hypothetical protein